MTQHWEEVLKGRLQLYGHRNWLVIADSAYPAQSRQAIETIVADAEHMAVLTRTSEILHGCKHIKPKIYNDAELAFVSEGDAPGVTSYRERLCSFLKSYQVEFLPHEEIIAKLDRVGEMFQVLLVKTNMRIPYTSVFFELECGYWNVQAEERLRTAMRADGRNRASNITESVARQKSGHIEA